MASKNFVEQPSRKDVKTKFFLMEKNSNQSNHAYVKGFKFGKRELT